MNKMAAAIGSATPDPAKVTAATVPTSPVALENKPAPGQTGPRGLAPRTTYSRVNTGAPPVPDAGASPQKSAPPRGLEFLPTKVAEVSMTDSMMTRPSLQDLVKEAMAGTIARSEISAEAARHIAGAETGAEEKTASPDKIHVPSEYVEKLADALGYLADHFEKTADSSPALTPGKGPGALQVLESQNTGDNPSDAGKGGQATSAHVPPKNPPTQTEQTQSGKANTGLQTNDSMSHPAQPAEPIKNEKASLTPPAGDKTITASVLLSRNLERLSKIGQKEKCEKCGDASCAGCDGEKKGSVADAIRKAAVEYSREKKAEDAINPAQISGGASTPPAASASESAVPSEPSDVSKQKSMISTNQAAIDYTKREAKADAKSDVGDVVTEPALSASTDKVLQQTLAHNDEAGSKISSASQADSIHKVAAARALLSKLAQDVAAEKAGGKKKEKESMLTPTPQGHSGFNASSMGASSAPY